MDWLDDVGLVTLPSGVRVRGRRLSAAASPADFTLVLADGPVPPWVHRRVAWPDFGVPADRDDAIDALRDALDRARSGARVEAACAGGRGRTGTALAALAILDGLPARAAVRLIRSTYSRLAIETPGQLLWLRRLP